MTKWKIVDRTHDFAIKTKAGCIIAYLPKFEGGTMEYDALPNAQLISSAPDLLKALEGMLESYDVLMNDVIPKDAYVRGSISGGFLHEPDNARKIIAKAKGL